MEKSSLFYIKEWQKALQAEIAHLKNYGSKKYHLLNGRKLTGTEEYTYYFDSHQSIPIPNGSLAKLQYGDVIEEGRILPSLSEEFHQTVFRQFVLLTGMFLCP